MVSHNQELIKKIIVKCGWGVKVINLFKLNFPPCNVKYRLPPFFTYLYATDDSTARNWLKVKGLYRIKKKFLS